MSAREGGDGGWVLLADIGGTNARFALASLNGDPREAAGAVYRTGDHADLPSAIAAFLREQGAGGRRQGADLRGAAVCGAGPVTGGAGAGRIEMTNCPWTLSVAAIREATGVAAPLLLNDFTAVALAIPALRPDEYRALGGGIPGEGAPIAVLGPGTGLGVSGLIPHGDGSFTPLTGEGGHVDLAPGDEREIALLSHLMRQYGHVSAERVISGPGLEVLYRAICALEEEEADSPLTAADIVARAREGKCERCAETVARFTGWLGAVAGDLALTLGAWGGVFIAGGVVPRMGEVFDANLFRRRFEAKGRFAGYLSSVPTYLMTAEHPAFIGLHRALQHA